MADKKISALTGASTPLAGTEVLPVVQSGATVKVSVSDLTAGRSITSSKLEASSSGELLKLITSGNTASGGLAFLRFYDSVGARGYVGYVGTDTLQVTGSKIELQPAAGNNILFSVGNLTQGTAAKGVNFTANTPAAGMTSQLLNAYEEGTWTPDQGAGLTVVGAFSSAGKYTRIGRQVTILGYVAGATSVAVSAGGNVFTNAPFTTGSNGSAGSLSGVYTGSSSAFIGASSTTVSASTAIPATAAIAFTVTYFI